MAKKKKTVVPAPAVEAETFKCTCGSGTFAFKAAGTAIQSEGNLVFSPTLPHESLGIRCASCGIRYPLVNKQ